MRRRTLATAQAAGNGDANAIIISPQAASCSRPSCQVQLACLVVVAVLLYLIFVVYNNHSNLADPPIFRPTKFKLKLRRKKSVAISRPNQQMLLISNEQTPRNVTLTLADLTSLHEEDRIIILSKETSQAQVVANRQPILQLLTQAGLHVDDNIVRVLPRWKDVTSLYGAEPVILGMEGCEAFRAAVPPELRFVGVAGQMNAGTTAMWEYMRNNLQIRQNYQHFGMLPKVPWYKHGWRAMRNQYNKSLPLEHDHVLPIILIRDPYFWMHSMCESPYTMEWNRNSSNHCPNLVREAAVNGGDVLAAAVAADSGVPVSIRWGKYERTWASLAHVWSEWYKEYLDADFPRLLIRFEDMLFHTPKVLEAIRECAGATWRYDHVVFVTEAVKNHSYFDSFKTQSGLLSAMIRYGRDHGRRSRNMTKDDLAFARQHLDPELMRTFGYQWPS